MIVRRKRLPPGVPSASQKPRNARTKFIIKSTLPHHVRIGW